MGWINDDGSRLYEFTAELRGESAGAYLIHDSERAVWLPKTETEYDGDTFIVPEWLAIEKELV